MLKFIASFLVLSASLLAHEQKESVVCLHGFMGSAWNMRLIEKRLIRDHWNPVVWHYPSRERLIEEHAEELVAVLIELAHKNPHQPIHFVAHSMGGLVALSALNHPSCPIEAKSGKLILLAPPVRGSYWGRWIGKFSLAKWIAKEFSGAELMTKTQFDVDHHLSSLQGILVVAGSRGFNPLFNEQNDGTLAVSETVLPIPHQHVVIKQGHKTMVFSQETYDLISHFLKDPV